jgi:transposase
MKKGFLGLDVSKGYCDFCLMDESGKELEKIFQLDDSRKGHDKLKAGLSRLLKKHKLDQIDCGLESTGGYEDHWYDSLLEWGKELPLRVARLNPSVVKNSALAELRPDTTDGMSARNIATYMRRYSDQVNFDVRSNEFTFSAIISCMSNSRRN